MGVQSDALMAEAGYNINRESSTALTVIACYSDWWTNGEFPPHTLMKVIGKVNHI